MPLGCTFDNRGSGGSIPRRQYPFDAVRLFTGILRCRFITVPFFIPVQQRVQHSRSRRSCHQREICCGPECRSWIPFVESLCCWFFFFTVSVSATGLRVSQDSHDCWTRPLFPDGSG